MTLLRKRVLEELERRNYSKATACAYVGAIRRFAEFFHRSPERPVPSRFGNINCTWSGVVFDPAP